MIHHASKHAQVRAQQRGITVQMDELLNQFGSYQHDHHGAEIIFFDHYAREKAQRHLGARATAKLESKLFKCYKVVSVYTGETITTGLRNRRIRRS
jgi:hypothetical protein